MRRVLFIRESMLPGLISTPATTQLAAVLVLNGPGIDPSDELRRNVALLAFCWIPQNQAE